MSLTERFKRLPEEQQLRNEESARQAQEASELLKRLKKTREEAEKVAMEEVERTRRTQREEIEMHPEIVELKRRLRTAEIEKEIWERKMREGEKNREKEVEALKRQEDLLMKRFNEAQDQELQIQREFERKRAERESKETRFRELEYQLQNLHREEEVQFQGDSEALKGQLSELEARFSNQKDAESKLKQFEDEIRSGEDALDRIEGSRREMREKEGRLAEDLLKAQSLVADAKILVEQTAQEVQLARSDAEHFEKAQNDVYEAQKRISELENASKSFESERESLKRAIENKQRRMDALSAEIEKLQREFEGLQGSRVDDCNALYDLENSALQSEIDLKDAKQHHQDAVDRRDFLARERRHFGDLERQAEAAKSTLLEAQNEEKKAADLIDQLRNRIDDLTREFNGHADRINAINSDALNLRASIDKSSTENLPQKIDETKRNLTLVMEKWSEWRLNRQKPLQEEFDSLKSWLSSHPTTITTSAAQSQSKTRTEAIWKDLERCRSRIRDLQSTPPLPATFEDASKLRSTINEREAQLQQKLLSRTGQASPRFLAQLEREAEALMRAEIAATHEQKQAAIEKEANELSQLRLALKPKVALDNEAQRRLWQVNRESDDTGRIAESIIDLCRNQNITLKQ